MAVPQKLTFFLLATYILLFCSACTSGWHHDYAASAPQLQAKSRIPHGVHVVIRDARAPSPDAAPAETHVGTVNAALGEPWFVRTASGKPLAEELGIALCRTLQASGLDCTTSVGAGTDEASEKKSIRAELLPLLPASGNGRLLHLVLTDWHVSVYADTTISYDIRVEVLGDKLELLSSVALSGKTSPDRETYFNPAENASIVAPALMRSLLQKVLTHREIQESLHLARKRL